MLSNYSVFLQGVYADTHSYSPLPSSCPAAAAAAATAAGGAHF